MGGFLNPRLREYHFFLNPNLTQNIVDYNNFPIRRSEASNTSAELPSRYGTRVVNSGPFMAYRVP
jgi:hypothetical protein